MRKKKFSKVKAVKQRARDTIGTPRPTTIKSHRKPGGDRAALDPNLNQTNHAVAPHYVKREEHIEGSPRLSKVEGLHIKSPIVLPKPRQGPREKSPCLQYSPEVIAHANVLREMHGVEAVKQYLSNLKEQNHMASHADIAEDLTRSHEAIQVDGSISTALKDAELKIGFYQEEIKRCTKELERWSQIAAGLKNVIKLTVGEVTLPKAQVGERRPRGYWTDKLRVVMNNGGSHTPLTRRQLQDKLAAGEHGEVDVYQVMFKALKDGAVVEIDGKLVLPEWTDPKK
jgi:hypothetical protein